MKLYTNIPKVCGIIYRVKYIIPIIGSNSIAMGKNISEDQEDDRNLYVFATIGIFYIIINGKF